MNLVPDEEEVYENKVFSLVARNSRDKIEVCKTQETHGFGIRVVKDGSIGFSFYSEEKEQARKNAVKSALLSKTEGYSLPGKSSYSKAKNFDPKIKKLDENDIVELLLQSMEGASEKAEPSKGEVSASVGTTKITNSNGVNAESQETMFSAFVSAKKGEAIGYDYAYKKKLDFDLKKLGEEAGLYASKAEGGKPIDFQGEIVLSVEVLSQFFSACVLRNLNAENVRRGKSLWKKGQQVMDSSISISEDPFRQWSAGTSSFDDEGVPTKKKTLIKNGVVQNFFYDSRTANLEKTESTGNGFRKNFTDSPSINSTNIVLSSENVSEPKGVFVKELMGFHNMNPVTGDFALDIVQGFVLEEGLGKPVKGCMLVGNFLNALKTKPFFTEKEEGKGAFFSPKMIFEGRVVSK